MEIRYALVGYNKKTERLVSRFFVPDKAVTAAKEIAQIPASAENQLGDWELDPKQAEDIAELIPAEVDFQSQDYFLEPYAGS